MSRRTGGWETNGLRVWCADLPTIGTRVSNGRLLFRAVSVVSEALFRGVEPQLAVTRAGSYRTLLSITDRLPRHIREVAILCHHRSPSLSLINRSRHQDVPSKGFNPLSTSLLVVSQNLRYLSKR